MGRFIFSDANIQNYAMIWFVSAYENVLENMI